MGLYSFGQKIRYRLKAKGRHGVHSPFIYDFIEQVLLRGSAGSDRLSVVDPKLNDRQQYLLSAIAIHYRVRELVIGGERTILNDKGSGSLYLVMGNDSLPPQFSEHDIIMVSGIYTNQERTNEWIRLYKRDLVPLSIDVFEMGILFFKKEFMIKQHFILKYR